MSPFLDKAKGKPLPANMSIGFTHTEGGQNNNYGTHLQESSDSASNDENAAKPYMYRCKLGGVECLFVDAMMDETQEKLDDHENGHQQPHDLMGSVEAFALQICQYQANIPNRCKIPPNLPGYTSSNHKCQNQHR